MERRNIRLALLFTFISAMASGIYGYSTMSGYLYTLTGKNLYVGLAEGIQGMVQCFASIPAGIAADRYKNGRSSVLKIAACFGCAATVVTSIGLLIGSPFDTKFRRFVFVTTGMSIIGIYQGLWATAIPTIYSDSVPTGKRSQYVTYRYIARLTASLIGPGTAIVLYKIFGDNWGLDTQKTVFVIGLFVSSLGSLCLFFFQDVQSNDTANSLVDTIHETREQKYSVGQRCCGRFCAKTTCDRLPVPMWTIPYFLLTTDVLFGLASGMTIKFFPLFFRNEVNLSPVSICLVYIAAYVLMAMLTRVAQMISKRVGRVQTTLSFSFFGIWCLISMSEFESWWTKPHIICPVYVLRTALMNCCSPLRKSILMDYTTKEARGRWNSLDGITRFGWSGSAFLGGYLVDQKGYGYTFRITALMQATAWTCSLWLIPLIFMERSVDNSNKEEDEGANIIIEDDVMEKPLLSRTSEDSSK